MNNNLGRFRLSVTGDADPSADPFPKHVREALSVPAEKRTQNQVAGIFSYWRTTVAAWKADNERIEQLWKHWPIGSTQLVAQSATRSANDEHPQTR